MRTASAPFRESYVESPTTSHRTRGLGCGLLVLLLTSVGSVAEAQYVKASVASYSSSAPELAPDDVPGATLVFTPVSASDVWIVLISARLRGTTTGFKGAEARYLINGSFAGLGDVKNSVAGSPGPWQHFARITGTTARQVVQVQLSAPDGGTATIENLQMIAFRLPGSADFQFAETAGQQGVAAGLWGDYRSLTFTPSSTGNYLIMAVANFIEPSGSSTVAVRLRDSGGAFWPVDSDGTRNGFLANGSANWQTFFLARVQSLNSGSSHTFTIQANGAPGGSVLRDQRIMAFRTDAFDNAESVETLPQTSTNSTTPQVKTTLNTSAAPARRDHVIIQSEVLRNSSATSARRAGFEANDVVQTSYSHVINDTLLTSYGFFDAVSVSSSIKYENTYSTSSIFFTVAAKESVIHALRLPTCSPRINYRSIGTAAGILYNTGTATVDAGAVSPTTVTFGGLASLPANVGLGDRLILDPGGSPEELFILSRDSATEVTVQTPAVLDHTAVSYEIRRAYSAIQAWETDRQGNLVAENRREVGVAYDDGDFTAGASIEGSTTDACSFMMLTVASGQRHQGTAGTGVVLDGLNTDQGIRVQDDYSVVEWFEFKQNRGGLSASSIVVQQASNVLLQNLLVHDFDDAVESVTGIRGESNAGYTVRNSIFYDGDTAAVRNNDPTATGLVQNCTVYAMGQWGVLSSAGGLTVTNTLSLGNPSGDFSGAMTQSYNISSDATASGTGSLTGRTATANPNPGAGNWVLFQNLTAGGENLHLQAGVENDAIDAGSDLSSSFRQDIDGESREAASWDVGADEFGQSLVVTGTYTGDGVVGRQIIGLGFQPDVVIVKVDYSSAATGGVVRTATMSGSKTVWGTAAPQAGLITSLDANGFTIGNDIKVNSVTDCGGPCTYYWTAFKAGTDLRVGTYNGNGTLPTDTQAITGLGYSPDYLILIAEAANRYARNRTRFGGNASMRLRDAGLNSDTIPSLDGDGFTVQVGADPQDDMNSNGVTYHYVAFDEVAGKVKVGSYPGNLIDDTSVTGVGFQPEYVLAQAYTDDYPVIHRSDKMVGDASSDLFGGLQADRVQALLPDGFQIGADPRVNLTGISYGYVAFNATPIPTAVALASFTATGLDGSVLLEWETASEWNNLGFHLHRALREEGPYVRITPTAIPGLGSSPEGARYRYRDSDVSNARTYYYQLEDIETTGGTTRHGPVSATPEPGAWNAAPNEDDAPPARITYGDPSANEIHVVGVGADSAVVELRTEGFYAVPQPDGTVQIEVPGFDVADDAPLWIPVKRTWVEAVGGRKVTLTAVGSGEVERFAGLRPSAMGGVELEATRAGAVRAVRRGRPGGERSFGTYPGEPARLLSVGFQQDVKKALVELAPLRWEGSQLVLSRRLEVRLSFRGRDRSETARRRRYREGGSRSSRNLVARLVTRERGLYRVSLEELFGRSHRSIVASDLRLSRQGDSVPFHMEGSALYFLSEGASANPYGREAVYELETDAPGSRMEEIAAPAWGPPARHYWHRSELEENRLYQAAILDAPDRWLWDALLAPVKKSYEFEITGLVPVSAPSSLEIWLQGTSDFPADPDHHVRAYLNRTLLEEVSWDGKTTRKLAIEVPPGVLREGGNLLEIENVGDTGALYSMVMLDRFAVEYPRLVDSGLEGRFSESGTADLGYPGYAFDVTGGEPLWLGNLLRFRVEGGRKYRVVRPESVLRPEVRRPRASVLKNEANRADYVVVGPEAFLSAAEPLIELRRSRGLRVKAVSIEEVYSAFGFGEETPEAIREFLAFAFHRWQSPSLRYVLLLGDGTYDFKDYLGTGVKNRVPPFIIKTRYLWTASDPAYASVNGDDGLPDVAVGRLPASSVEEVRRMVDKIVAYETGAESAPAPIVLVADDPDGAGDFEANAEELASGLLASRPLRKIYLGRLGTTATRQAVVDAFDAGASLLSYIGHGGIHLWASENVFDIEAAASLSPQARQPLLLTMNCLNGYFHFPYFNSLAEELVKADGKGAIAAFSPSGLSLDDPAHSLHRALLIELFSGGHTRLGDAVLAAQHAYAATGVSPELLGIYHLLGDPALELR